ncbi:hypothetical protein PVK06_020744 [Gossypium arboreum]|uniref:Uncharacterized protein n=1 Tax=Gossypium arboreum TaxID=29729 RepID=A0ABR0PNF9_GOSAR|nr:hypothetical protein PVK06_020744 [Gossypium arboreum]
MLPDFIQSFFAGMAASGALTSALRVITIAAFEKSNNGLRKGAILLYAYFFPKLPIVKYFRSKAALEGSKTVQADLAAAGIQIKEDNIESRKGLTIAILSRFLLIPSFYFTAKYGDQGWMILLVSFLGLTNGHLTICVMTAAPKGYKVTAGVVSCRVSLDWLWFIGKKNAL